MARITISAAAEQIVREYAAEHGGDPHAVAVYYGDPAMCHAIADRSGASRRLTNNHPLNVIQSVLNALDRDPERWAKSYILAHCGHSPGHIRDCTMRAYRLRRTAAHAVVSSEEDSS